MPRVIPWTELRDLEQVAQLYDRSAESLESMLAGWPSGVRGYALESVRGVIAAALRVEGEGSLSLAQLTRDPVLQPRRALPLVAWGEQQAREHGAPKLRISLKGAPGLGPLLEARGYALTERFLRLVLDGEPPAPAPLPEGVRPVSLAEIGVERFLAMSNTAFATVPGALPLGAQDWERMTQGPGYRDDLLQILVGPSGPLGFVRAEVEAAVGSIDALGLVPRARGLGLGRWLLRWCGRALRDQGHETVDLWVAESNTPALRLYTSEGYRQVLVRESWELDLTKSEV